MKATPPLPCWSVPASLPRAMASAFAKGCGPAGPATSSPRTRPCRPASIASSRNSSRAICRSRSPFWPKTATGWTMCWRSAAPIPPIAASRSTWRFWPRAVRPPPWASAACMAVSAAASSSRCFRACRRTKCRSVMSPMACTCLPGTRRNPTASGPKSAARNAGGNCRTSCIARSPPSPTRNCGACAARGGSAPSSMRAGIWPRNCASAASTRAPSNRLRACSIPMC